MWLNPNVSSDVVESRFARLVVVLSDRSFVTHTISFVWTTAVMCAALGRQAASFHSLNQGTSVGSDMIGSRFHWRVDNSLSQFFVTHKAVPIVQSASSFCPFDKVVAFGWHTAPWLCLDQATNVGSDVVTGSEYARFCLARLVVGCCLLESIFSLLTPLFFFLLLSCRANFTRSSCLVDMQHHLFTLGRLQM